MTSMPASRQAATMRLQRLWPSSPIFVTNTRGSEVVGVHAGFPGDRGEVGLQQADEAAGDPVRREAAVLAVPGLAPVECAYQHKVPPAAVGRARERQRRDEGRSASSASRID